MFCLLRLVDKWKANFEVGRRLKISIGGDGTAAYRQAGSAFRVLALTLGRSQ